MPCPTVTLNPYPAFPRTAFPTAWRAVRSALTATSIRRHSSASLRCEYRARLLRRIPPDIDRRHDVPGDEQIILENAARVVLARTMRDKLSDRFAVLGDDDRLARACDFVQQGKAFGLEFRSLDKAGHRSRAADHGHHHGQIAGAGLESTA